MANIFARVSIRWLPAPASEPTSTLVTTSPSLKFVDLRLPASLDHSTPPQWAIAGRTVVGTPMRWVHEIDSRTDTPGEDSGVNTPLPNGDTLEKGRMVDGEDGQVKDYEEVWREVNIDEGIALVLECASDEGARGRVVRVGGYCQGMIKVGERTSCERHVRDKGKAKWERVYRYGDAEMPCDLVCLGRGLLTGDHEAQVSGEEGDRAPLGREVEIGDRFKVNGHTWEVTEKCLW